MDDLIRRGALEMVLLRETAWYDNRDEDVAYAAVQAAPSVDAVEVVHARWYVDEYPSGFVVHRCIACGCEPPRLPWQEKPYAYCPNCGARMDVEAISKTETTTREKEVKQDG